MIHQIKRTILFFILISAAFSTLLFAQIPSIKTAWTANNESDLSHYIIYRDSEPGTMVFLDSIPKTDTTYTDYDIVQDQTYYYKLTAVDTTGYESDPSNEVMAKLSPVSFLEEANSSPTDFKLKQNYPNPFNPSTTIEYIIPRHSYVSITIYNVMGQEVRRLVNEFKEAGVYKVQWDGKDKNGVYLPSGVYFHQMLAENYMAVKKAIFQK